MAKAVRLADVARAAGVSQGTASNVFNRPGVVRPEVRERVEDFARQLGYSGPDPRGRLLRAGKVNAIGVVVSDKLGDFFRDPYNREFMAGLTEVCDARGAGVSLISAADERAAAWSIESAVVDGFVLQCVEDGSRLLEQARRRKLPFVAIDLDAGAGMSTLNVDHRGGARLAAEHLLSLGHRRFAILALEFACEGRVGLVDAARRGRIEDSVTADRLAGYGDALAAAGIDVAAVPTVETPNNPADATTAAKLLLAQTPDATAILAMSDVIALAAMKVARERGREIPRDLSIVGFDDIAEAATADPPLTTVRQPIVEKGRRAAQLIFDHGAPRTEMLAVNLVVRGSAAPPPAR